MDPGFTKTRGILLSELNKTNLVLAREDLKTDRVAGKKKLEKAVTERQFLLSYFAFYQSLFHGKPPE